jgi:hypothetical protein
MRARKKVDEVSMLTSRREGRVQIAAIMPSIPDGVPLDLIGPWSARARCQRDRWAALRMLELKYTKT